MAVFTVDKQAGKWRVMEDGKAIGGEYPDEAAAQRGIREILAARMQAGKVKPGETVRVNSAGDASTTLGLAEASQVVEPDHVAGNKIVVDSDESEEQGS